MAKVVIHSEACVGCGFCVSTAPEAFEFNDEGKAVVVAELDDAVAEEVISSCPAAAISK